MNATCKDSVAASEHSLSALRAQMQTSVASVLFLLAAIITLGNSLTIYVLSNKDRFHSNNTTNYLVLNLAAADLLTGMMLCVFEGSIRLYDNGRYFKDKYYCLADLFVGNMFIGNSMITIFYLALDRYIAICHPFRYPVLVTPRRTLLAIAGSWIYVIITSSLPLLGLNIWNCKAAIPSCESVYLYTRNYVNFQLAQVIVAVSTNSVLQGLVFREVKKKQKQVIAMTTSQNSGNENNSYLMKERAKSRMTMTLFAAFIICWMPYMVLSPFKGMYPGSDVVGAIHDVTYIFGIFNSAFNIVIYGWNNSSMRKAYLEIVMCKG